MSCWSLIELTKGCRKLKTLCLISCNRVTDDHICSLFTYCTQLTCLHLCDYLQFSGKCLETGGTAALRRLYIQECHSESFIRQCHSEKVLKTNLCLSCFETST